MKPTFGSLFAGIGGIDLGFERAGLECKWQVEIDLYARRVLAKHWPNVRRHDDIRTWPQPDTERVDIIAGGFPCQDISHAGKGVGINGQRSGLFFELMRVVRVLRPRIVVLENVSALLFRGMGVVLGSLARDGFDAEWGRVAARDVGAPHVRERVFIIATAISNDDRNDGQSSRKDEGKEGTASLAVDGGQYRPRHAINQTGRELPDTESQRRRSRRTAGVGSRQENKAEMDSDADGRGRQVLEEFDGEAEQDSANGSPRGRHPDGLRNAMANAERSGLEEREGIGSDLRAEFAAAERSGRERANVWATEPDVGRVADGVPSRVDRLRGLGNAVVPQVAEYIGHRVVELLQRKGSHAQAQT